MLCLNFLLLEQGNQFFMYDTIWWVFLPYVLDIDIIYRLFPASQDNNLLLLEEENTFGGPNTVYWAPKSD